METAGENSGTHCHERHVGDEDERDRVGYEGPPEMADEQTVSVPVESGQVQVEGTRRYPRREHKLPLRYR